MSKIIVNGEIYECSAKGSIEIANGKVIVNGKDVTPEHRTIDIHIDGDVGELKVDYCSIVDVIGSVGGDIKTKSGDVEVTGDVLGSIQTMSGDVDCVNVGGSISTMSGDVKHKTIKK